MERENIMNVTPLVRVTGQSARCLLIEESDISGVVLNKVNAAGAQLTDVDITGGTVTNCNLTGLTVTGCTLEGVTINGVPLQEALDFWKETTKAE